MNDAAREKQPVFRTELERLEAIVRQLERSDVDLDDAIQLFEEGVQRLRNARKLLEESDLRIRKVLESTRGELRYDDVDV